MGTEKLRKKLGSEKSWIKMRNKQKMGRKKRKRETKAGKGAKTENRKEKKRK